MLHPTLAVCLAAITTLTAALPPSGVPARPPALRIIASWPLPTRDRATLLASEPDAALAISAVALTSRRIVVADALGDRLLVLDTDGHVHQEWRGGGREAEIAVPIAVLPREDGTLWVQNYGHARMAVFRAVGDSLQFQRLLRAGPRPIGLRDAASPDDPPALLAVPGVPSTGKIPMPDVVRLDPRGQEISRRPLPAPAGSLVVFTHVAAVRGGQQSSMLRQPLSAGPLAAVGPAGNVATAFSDRYDIVWIGPTGRATHVQRPLPPRVPLTSTERDSVELLILAWSRAHTVARNVVPFGPPTVKPHLQRLAFDGSGRLWVERAAAAGQPGVVDLYSSPDRAPRRVDVPAGLTLLPETARGDTLFAVRLQGRTRTILRVVLP